MVSVAQAETVIQVVTENWSPYNYKQGNQVSGSATEIVRKVLDRAGFSYQIKVYPWARAYKKALENENTLIYTLVRLPSREQQFHWVGAVALEDKTYLYKLKSRSDISIKNIDEIRNYRIGVIRESMYHHYLENLGFHDQLKFIPKLSLNYSKLTQNRIDLWAEGEQNFQAEIARRAKLGPVVTIEPAYYLFSYPYYMAFSLNTSDQIIEKVRRAYIALVQEGEIPSFSDQLPG